MVDQDLKDSRKGWWALLLPLRMAFTIIVLASEIIRPVYRPLVGWISSLTIVRQFADFVARLPRLAILILFIVPFAIAEPLKIVGIIVMSKGSLISGLGIIVGAYLMSFILVERIFHAGRDKLLTYAWLRWIMTRVDAVRAAISTTKQKLIASFRDSRLAKWVESRIKASR